MSTRKLGPKDSKTSDLIVEAAMQIMLEDGYAAVTSRRVGAKAGVNPALVHYYFPTMDQLFLTVFRRGADANLKRQQQALASDRPLRALWDLSTGPFGAKLLMEFMALGNHRKDIRTEIATYVERFREVQQTAFRFILQARGISTDSLPPVLLSIMLGSFASILVNEQTLEINLGHPELFELVEKIIASVEPAADDPAATGKP